MLLNVLLWYVYLYRVTFLLLKLVQMSSACNSFVIHKKSCSIVNNKGFSRKNVSVKEGHIIMGFTSLQSCLQYWNYVVPDAFWLTHEPTIARYSSLYLDSGA
jgi:hypothetical protein